MPKIIRNGIEYGSPEDASHTSYDNSSSGISATNVNDAIDEIRCKTYYGVCSSQGAVRTVTLINGNDFVLAEGVTIHIKFEYAGKSNSITLNVNNTGGKYIKAVTETTGVLLSYGQWLKGQVCTLTYDGTYWLVNDGRLDADNIKFDGGTSGITSSSVQGAIKEVNTTATTHTHGNIQNGGTLQTNDITIANGDKIVVTDASDSAKVARTSISFDGSTATKCLTQKGTWATFGTSNLTLGTTATTALAGNTTAYVKAGRNLKIYAGTSVVTIPNATDSVGVMTNTQLNSWFGVSNCSNANVAVFGSNGDPGAWDGHLEGMTYLNGTWYACWNKLNNSGAGKNCRVNWLAIYFT